jgi:hypothetical protein
MTDRQFVSWLVLFTAISEVMIALSYQFNF